MMISSKLVSEAVLGDWELTNGDDADEVDDLEI